ncbi:MAG: homoserine O-acetyltransferase [Planctomycetota bacterium]|jgi:homoserine O-acetyltransferase
MADEENAYSFTTAATRKVKLSNLGNEGFAMWRGGHLAEVEIAFETWGELSSNADNAILIFTGLSPSAHAAMSEQDPTPGWWEYMVGPGKAIDTDRFFVICMNSLGGCHGTTGPCSIDPVSGEKYGAEFPGLSIEDIAAAGHGLVTELGIKCLHAAVGSSMGGMASMTYGLRYPGEMKYLISISAATQALPLTIALRSLQREMIRSDPAWDQGRYKEGAEPVLGMALARKLGLVSYRAADEWNSKFDRRRVPEKDRGTGPFGLEFDIENYLEYNAQKFIHSFDANSYQFLSRAMDWFDVSEHGNSLSDGMARLKVTRALVIGVTTDILFPLRQQREVADLMCKTGTDVELVEIDSVNGHDAFLIDDSHFSPVVKQFLDESMP